MKHGSVMYSKFDIVIWYIYLLFGDRRTGIKSYSNQNWCPPSSKQAIYYVRKNPKHSCICSVPYRDSCMDSKATCMVSITAGFSSFSDPGTILKEFFTLNWPKSATIPVSEVELLGMTRTGALTMMSIAMRTALALMSSAACWAADAALAPASAASALARLKWSTKPWDRKMVYCFRNEQKGVHAFG